MIRTSLAKAVPVTLSCAPPSAETAMAQCHRTHAHRFDGAENWAQVFKEQQ